MYRRRSVNCNCLIAAAHWGDGHTVEIKRHTKGEKEAMRRRYVKSDSCRIASGATYPCIVAFGY